MNLPLEIYVIGYGQAGQIHARTYQKLIHHNCRLVGIIETSPVQKEQIKKELPDINIYDSLEQIPEKSRKNAVLDFCVQSPFYLEIVQKAKILGINRMMLEKPLAWSLPAATALHKVLSVDYTHYLDTYQFSTGIKKLLKLLQYEQNPLETICIYFNKNRIGDSLKKRGFDGEIPPNAWYVEGPHMVTIALLFGGTINNIEEAYLYDMLHKTIIFPKHGGAKAHIKHKNGIKTFLSMDLCSKSNERIVELILKNNIKFRLFLPASKTVQFISRIEKIVDNHVLASYNVEDRPMEQCIESNIIAFAENQQNAVMISHGLEISNILDKLTTESIKSNSIK